VSGDTDAETIAAWFGGREVTVVDRLPDVV
jgi:hypothetical protein